MPPTSLRWPPPNGPPSRTVRHHRRPHYTRSTSNHSMSSGRPNRIIINNHKHRRLANHHPRPKRCGVATVVPALPHRAPDAHGGHLRSHDHRFCWALPCRPYCGACGCNSHWPLLLLINSVGQTTTGITCWILPNLYL